MDNTDGTDNIEKATFSDVLASLVSGVCQARALADKEVLQIAEIYKQHEQLRGLTVPRLRLSKVTVELPVLLNGISKGKAFKMSKPNIIVNAAKAALNSLKVNEENDNSTSAVLSETQGLENDSRERVKYVMDKILPIIFSSTFIDDFANKLDPWIKYLSDEVDQSTLMHSGQVDVEVLNKVNKILSDVLHREINKKISEQLVEQNEANNLSQNTYQQICDILVDRLLIYLRKKTALAVISVHSCPPDMQVDVITDMVKNTAAPGTAMRIQMVLREEGVEWHNNQTGNGDAQWKLLPE